MTFLYTLNLSNLGIFDEPSEDDAVIRMPDSIHENESSIGVRCWRAYYTHQRMRAYVSKGKAHGGQCTECHLFKLNGKTPPDMLNFLRCGCAREVVESTFVNLAPRTRTNKGDWRGCSANPFKRSFYGGRGTRDDITGKIYYTGVDVDGYSFSECLHTKEGLWYIQNSRGELIRPRDATDNDLVFVNWPLIELFALTYIFREGVLESLRMSDLCSNDFLKKFNFEPLELKKKIRIPAPNEKESPNSHCWMNWKGFYELVVKDGMVVPPHYLKLMRNGCRSNSLAYEKDGVFPYWEKRKTEAESLASKLNLSQEAKEYLIQIHNPPRNDRERTFKKDMHCMKCCFPCVDGRPQCGNYQDPKKAGICYDCLFNSMDFHSNEEALEINRNEKEKVLYHSSKPKDFKDKNGTFHRGHFHSVAVACRLIDISSVDIRQSAGANFRMPSGFFDVWDELKSKIHKYNESGGENTTPVKAKGNFWINEYRMQMDSEAEHFLANTVNAFIDAIWSKTYLVGDTGVLAPIFCKSVQCSIPRRKRILRPKGGVKVRVSENVSVFKTADFYYLPEECWLKKTFERPNTSVHGRQSSLLFNGDVFNLIDISCDFTMYRYFIAVTNFLFTALVPDGLFCDINCSKCEKLTREKPAKRGSLITWDQNTIFWLHFDDTHAFFTGALKIAELGEHPPLNIVTGRYHKPDKIYYSTGDVGEWCSEKLCLDSEGVFLFKNDKFDEKTKIRSEVDMLDLVPFEIKLLILFKSPLYQVDLFDVALQSAWNFQNSDSNWDLKGDLLDTFEYLGYDWKQAVSEFSFQKKCKHPSAAIQEYYVQCAVRHCVESNEPVYIDRTVIPAYKVFSHCNSPFLKVTFHKGRVYLHPCETLGDKKVMQFYPSCRSNKDRDGFNWRRKQSKNFERRTNGGNCHGFCNLNSEVNQHFLPLMTGSEATFMKSKLHIPSAGRGKSKHAQHITSSQWAKFDFFSPFSCIPMAFCAKRGDKKSFTEICRVPSSRRVPRVFYNVDPIECEDAYIEGHVIEHSLHLFSFEDDDDFPDTR